MVGRIKAGGSETRILVADKECVEWHLEHKQTISSSLPYVIHLSSQRSTSPVPSSSSSSSLSAEEEAAQRENPPAPVQPIVEELQDLRDEMVSGNYNTSIRQYSLSGRICSNSISQYWGPLGNHQWQLFNLIWKWVGGSKSVCVQFFLLLVVQLIKKISFIQV